jgi:hypothetical protein
MQQLDMRTVKHMLSPYLMGGYRQDLIEVSQVQYDGERISAALDVAAYYMPSDGRYHFTAFHAQLFVSQLAILHMYLLKKITEKPGEAYMKNFNIGFFRQINKLQGIKVDVFLDKMSDTRRGIYASYNFDIEEGAFKGSCAGMQFDKSRVH